MIVNVSNGMEYGWGDGEQLPPITPRWLFIDYDFVY